jgi:hypothetical protein
VLFKRSHTPKNSWFKLVCPFILPPAVPGPTF